LGKEMSVSRNKARESRRRLGKALFPSGSSAVHAAALALTVFACDVGPAMPNPNQTRKLLNWATLAVLAALAAAMYVGIIVKVVKFGF
jgi:hypothetical protein